MYAQKVIVHNAHTLHTVRNVHNAHCAYRFKIQSCDYINFVRAIDRIAVQITNTNAFKHMLKDCNTIDLFHKIENPEKTLKEFLKQYDKLDRQGRNAALNPVVDTLESKQKRKGKGM